MKRRTFLKALTLSLVATQLPAVAESSNAETPKRLFWICIFNENLERATSWQPFEPHVVDGDDIYACYAVNKTKIIFEETTSGYWLASSFAVSSDKKTILFEGLLDRQVPISSFMSPVFGVGDLKLGID